MPERSRILIVGNTSGAKICERLIKNMHEAKRKDIASLTSADLSWCSFVITLSSELRRAIAETDPDAYLSRRVISLNIPEARAEDSKALRSMISEQLENHGLFVRDQNARSSIGTRTI